MTTEPMIPVDELRAAVFDDNEFQALVTVWGIDETMISLSALVTACQWEMTHGPQGKSERRRMVGQVITTSISRLHWLKTVAGVRNRERDLDVQRVTKLYGAFAERLADAIDGLDPRVLVTIAGPGDCTAAEWLDRRKERAAEKAERASA